MSDPEFILWASFLGDKHDLDPEEASDKMRPFRSRFLAPTLEQSKEAYYDVIVDGTHDRVGFDKRIGAILRKLREKGHATRAYSWDDGGGGGAGRWCRECDAAGVIEVPSHRDYSFPDRFWNGKYTCVVSCRCETGQRLKGQMTIDQYEAEFPKWRDEWPIRWYECRIRMASEMLFGGGDEDKAQRWLERLSTTYDFLLAVSAEEYIYKPRGLSDYELMASEWDARRKQEQYTTREQSNGEEESGGEAGGREGEPGEEVQGGRGEAERIPSLAE